MPLLEYENQVFLDAFHEDGLLVIAKGLGMERIFINFLKLYCDSTNLVLVLNTISQEEEYFIEQLQAQNIDPLPKTVTAEFSINERQSLYLKGGVLFVTSRILVVDLLMERLPVDLVTGMLVYRAHKLLDSCQEAFILRLYRQKNKHGFVKAFSDSPQSFTSGFCHVERVMKSLSVRKLFLWPRFHASVVACMEKHKVDVVEMQLQVTPSMLACQTALLDLLDACVKELKRGNPVLDTDEITVENAITKSFDKIVRLHLDPVWHQLSPKTKQLIADIKTLKLILEYLTHCDCVTFYSLVNSIRTSEKTFGSNSGWLFLDATDSLFAHAKHRVYGEGDAKAKRQKTDDTTSKPAQPKKDKEMLLEMCPKWAALTEVLDEIKQENERMGQTEGQGRVLVVAADDRACSQLREYLCDGGKELLLRLFNKMAGTHVNTGPKIGPTSGSSRFKTRAKGKGQGKAAQSTSSDSLTLTQMVGGVDDDAAKSKSGDAPLAEDSYGVLQDPPIVLQPLRGSGDPTALTRSLQQLQPRFVVLYDADMTFIRQLEVYRASRPGQPLRVYVLMYANSTEEQRYLTTLRKEKQAFEYLIKEKATMVIPEERGRTEEDPSLARDVTPANATVNTRKGDRAEDKQTAGKVIVDMREFRSELPSLIHRRGIDIEPVTIEVGDYILTPDICVERKSVSDLIGSLNNGRLYNQAHAMCRYYKRPVLLIEFDANKPFALQGKYPVNSEISNQDVTSKLTLLTLHFPRLRILWCQSPYATAELFEELKMGRPEPDAATALAISGETGEDITAAKFNYAPQQLLLKMPGITSKNVVTVMKQVESLSELSRLSRSELRDVLDNERSADLLHGFLHRDHARQGTGQGTGPGTRQGTGQGTRQGPATGRQPTKGPSTKR